MDKKTAYLALIAVVLMGSTMFLRLKPRLRRACQPYLVGGILLSCLATISVSGLTVAIRIKRRHIFHKKQRAIDQTVLGGETWLLFRPKEARSVDLEKVSLWKRLAYTQPHNEHFSFEVFGNSDIQGLALHASKHKIRALLREFFQEWPDIQRRQAGDQDPAQLPEGWHTYWVEVGPTSAEKPISCSSKAPLLSVLSEIAEAPASTRILVQVIARLDSATRRQLGQKSERIRSLDSKNAGARYQQTREARQLEQRGASVFLQVIIRMAAMSPSYAEARRTALALADTINNQFGPDNPVVILAHSNPKKPFDLASRSITGGATRSWASDEIVSLAYLPGGDALKFAPLLFTSSAKSIPADPDLRIPPQARLAIYHIQF
jgi:hypothetical protein